METRKLVDISGTITNSKNGETIILTMGKCRFGGSRFNLCSLTKLTDNGWKMSGNKLGIYLEKGDIIIHFNVPITTPEGRIWAIRFKRTHHGPSELSLANPAAVTMSIEQAHQYCGHNSTRETRRTAQHLGWRISGCWTRAVHRCEPCAVGKAKKTNLGPRESKLSATIGELWGINKMKLKQPVGETVPFPRNCCMNMAVDHKT